VIQTTGRTAFRSTNQYALQFRSFGLRRPGFRLTGAAARKQAIQPLMNLTGEGMPSGREMLAAMLDLTTTLRSLLG
jgi:hypothetical protein